MRRIIGATVTVAALVGAGLALAGQAATDATGRFIDISVAVSPPVAGTAKAPQGIGVTYDAFTGNRINGDTPSMNNDIVVRFSRGFVINGSKFPACTINPSTSQFTSCSTASQIGTGAGELSIPGANGAPPTFVSSKLVVYNGKPYRGGGSTVIFLATLGGKTVSELDFRSEQQRLGPYGLAFSEIQFPGAAPTGGAAASISKFSFTIERRSVTHRVKGKRVTTYLLQAPTTCNGSWQFAQTSSFSDGTPPLTATATQPCTTAR